MLKLNYLKYDYKEPHVLQCALTLRYDIVDL